MIKHAATAALLVGPIALLSACATDDQAAEEETTTTTTEEAPPGERLTTELRTADGTPVAEATFDFADGFATVTVETVATGILTPGFHGLHLHSVGQCEPDSEAPDGGPAGDFNSAGGHFHLPDEHPAAGDLTSLQVRGDGSARLVTTTDAFTAEDLRGDEGTVLIIHADPDNFAHIPDRYTIDGVPGPDEESLATGDAGARVACGVVHPGTATPAETTTTTTVVTETVPPPAVEETTPSPEPTPTETATETVTESPATTTPTPTDTESPTLEETSPTTTPAEGEGN